MVLGIGDLEGKTICYAGARLEIARTERELPKPHWNVWVSGSSDFRHAQYLCKSDVPGWLEHNGILARNLSEYDLALVDGLAALMLDAAEHSAGKAQITGIRFAQRARRLGCLASIYAVVSQPRVAAALPK